MACFDLLNTTLGGVRLAGDGLSRGWMRRQGPDRLETVARRHRDAQVRTGNGVVSGVAQRVAVIGVKLQAQALVPIATAVSAVDDRADIRQNVGYNGYDHDNNHNPVEEVIYSNDHHRGFPAITGRLEQPLNRR